MSDETLTSLVIVIFDLVTTVSIIMVLESPLAIVPIVQMPVSGSYAPLTLSET